MRAARGRSSRIFAVTSADADRWRAWKESTFGNDYMIWHDGLYTTGVASLTRDEREAALSMLRTHCASADVSPAVPTHGGWQCA